MEPSPTPPAAPPTSKVAIVGFSETTRHLAPYADPTFKVWGLGNLAAIASMPRFDLWFEMHTWDYLRGIHKDQLDKFEAFLAGLACPLYMLEQDPRFPTSIAYPLDRMNAEFFPPDESPGGPYWTNTTAYMLALAIASGFREIHLYGVDMAHKDEYVVQRPGVTYFVGLARGRGIRVYLPPKCALMHSRTVYGYDSGRSDYLEQDHSVFMTRRQMYLDQHDETFANFHMLDGRIQELQDLATFPADAPVSVLKLAERIAHYEPQKAARHQRLCTLDGHIEELALLIRRNEEQQRGGTW